MKNIDSNDLDQESEFVWSQEDIFDCDPDSESELECDREELPGNDSDSEFKFKRSKEEIPVDDLIQININEQVQYVTDKIAARHGKSGLNELDIEAVFRDAVTAYKEGNEQEFSDLMTIIFSKYRRMFESAPLKKLNNAPDRFNGKYDFILDSVSEQEIRENALGFYWEEILLRIQMWAEKGIPQYMIKRTKTGAPQQVDFSFHSQVTFIAYHRIFNHFDSTYFRMGNPITWTKSHSHDEQEPEGYFYTQIKDNRLDTPIVAISRMEKEQEFYNILDTNMRADKVIGSIYRIFLDYSDEMFWAEAIGRNFIELFDRFIYKFGLRFDLNLTGREIDNYRNWLKNKWNTDEEKLGGINIDGSYIITEEYAKAKGIDLTRWTSSCNTKIKNWKKQQELYNILVTDVRADKVIGAAYRIFLEYTNEMYWEEAVGSSFIELFNRLVEKFSKQMGNKPKDLDVQWINRYKKWLKEWKTDDTDLGITIDGSFIVTEEYSEVKNDDLTGWTANIYRAIITRNGEISYD